MLCESRLWIVAYGRVEEVASTPPENAPRSPAPRSPALRAADDPQVLGVRAVVDAPAVGAAVCHGQLAARAPHVVQPDQT